MKIKELLKNKRRPIVTISPDQTVNDAIKKLVFNRIGALPVCDVKGALVGIISERDLLRECSYCTGDFTRTKIKEVMTREVAVGIPDDNVDYVMNTMTQKGIRHLPIMDGPDLVGMISSRDAPNPSSCKPAAIRDSSYTLACRRVRGSSGATR